MKMKIIAIWHTPRTGSNLLCNLLHQTGVAGFASYIDSGFFIGYKIPSVETFDRAIDVYFKKMVTPNGVSGTKLSFEYMDDLKNISWKTWVKLIDRFDVHIVLSRRDRVAQAVSHIFAKEQNVYSSLSGKFEKRESIPVPYSRDRIIWEIAKIEQMESRFVNYLKWHKINYLSLCYEDVIENMRLTVSRVIDFAGINDKYEFKPPKIKKQTDDRKQEFIDRFNRGE